MDIVINKVHESFVSLIDEGLRISVLRFLKESVALYRVKLVGIKLVAKEKK